MAKRTAYRLVSLPFWAGALFLLALFVRGVVIHEIRTGTLAYALIAGGVAYGLTIQSNLGRMLAVLLVVANIGVGVLALISVAARGERTLLPSIFVVCNVALAAILTRKVFTREPS